SANVNTTSPGPFTITRCVVLETTTSPTSNANPGPTPGGSGFQLANIQSTTVDYNIVAHCDTSSGNSQGITWDPLANGLTQSISGNVVTRLIIFKINTAYANASAPTEVNVSSPTNYVDLTGSNTQGTGPEPFPHPIPTNSSLIGDYNQSLGGTGNYVDWLATCAA